MWYQRRVAEILGRRLRELGGQGSPADGLGRELQRTVGQLFDAVRTAATVEVVDAEQREADARAAGPSAAER